MSTNYTITNNAKFKSIEIKFNGKPVDAVRTLLKEHHFRWNPKTQVWYGYMDKAEMAKLLGKSVKFEKTPEKTPAKTAEKKSAKKTAEKTAPVSLFGTAEPDAPNGDEVTYFRQMTNGKFDKRVGKLDVKSGTVIEKVDTVWEATDYLSGLRVAQETTKKALMAKLAELADKVAEIRNSDRYKALCEKLADHESHAA